MFLIPRDSEPGALSEIVLFGELRNERRVVNADIEHVEPGRVLFIVAPYVCTVVPSLHHYGDTVELRVSRVKNVPRHAEFKLVRRRTYRTLQ